jgi:hypothetical protein
MEDVKNTQEVVQSQRGRNIKFGFETESTSSPT